MFPWLFPEPKYYLEKGKGSTHGKIIHWSPNSSIHTNKITWSWIFILITFKVFTRNFISFQFEAETWPVQNENTSIQYPVWFPTTEVSVAVFNLKNIELVSVSVLWNKNLKCQYSLSVSFFGKKKAWKIKLAPNQIWEIEVN